MSLNIVVDAIHSDDIVSVNVLDTEVDSPQAAGSVTWKLPANEAKKGWIVPGSVKIISQAAGSVTRKLPANETKKGWIAPSSVKIISQATSADTWDSSPATSHVATLSKTDYVNSTGTATFTGTRAASQHLFIQYKYFKADSVRRYTAAAVPTTLRFQNDASDADIVVAESDDGTNWLQIGAGQVKKWGIANFERAAQRQLKVASTSSGRLIGSPISAI